MSVAFPVVAALKFRTLAPEVKFEESGVVKLKTGKPLAPDGEEVTTALKVAVPLNPFNAFSVTSCVPDEPCVMEIDAGPPENMTPPTAMLKAPVAVLLAESVTFTVKGYVPAVVGVPVIAPAEDKLNPGGRLPETGVVVQV